MRMTQEQVRAHEARLRKPAAASDHAPDQGPESDLHEAIRWECIRRGWLPFHGAMSYRTHRTEGEPDFIILVHGRVMLVECKTRTGKVSPAQLGVIAHASRLGHTVHVVRSFAEFLEVAR
jgi:hypothetical protein